MQDKKTNTGAYHVEFKKLNSRDYGSCQNRERLIIVGWLRAAELHPFQWPKATADRRQPLPLADCLDAPERNFKPEFPTTKTELENLAHILEKLRGSGRSLTADIVVDLGRSTSWRSQAVPADNTAPTICSSRAAANGYYVLCRQRKLRISEYCRLFNIPPRRLRIPADVSENQVRRMIGNTWCIRVVAAVLSRLLYTAGLLNSVPMPGEEQGGVKWC